MTFTDVNSPLRSHHSAVVDSHSQQQQEQQQQQTSAKPIIQHQPKSQCITLNVAFTSNRKKRIQFFAPLEAAARTWRGYVNTSKSSQQQQQQVCVNLVPLFPDDFLSPSSPSNSHSNPQYDAIIHKRTDDMAAALLRHPYALHNVQKLHQFLSCTPLHLDNIKGVWKLLDRVEIARAIDQSVPRLSPSWTVVNSHTVDELRSIRYPVILKRRLACGTKAAHVMAVASDGEAAIDAVKHTILSDDPVPKMTATTPSPTTTAIALTNGDSHSINSSESSNHNHYYQNENGIIKSEKEDQYNDNNEIYECCSSIKDDVIAQRYIVDHGDVLFKIYAIGQDVVIQPRRSIAISISSLSLNNNNNNNRNNNDSNNNNNNNPSSSYSSSSSTLERYVRFDSQKLNKSTAAIHFDPVTRKSADTKAVLPSMEFTRQVVEKIGNHFGLSLLGVDIVHDVQHDEYVVVDVNYFPGYRGVPKANEWLLQHICERVVAAQKEVK